MTDRLASAPRLWPIVAKRLDIVLQDLASFRIRTWKERQENWLLSWKKLQTQRKVAKVKTNLALILGRLDRSLNEPAKSYLTPKNQNLKCFNAHQSKWSQYTCARVVDEVWQSQHSVYETDYHNHAIKNVPAAFDVTKKLESDQLENHFPQEDECADLWKRVKRQLQSWY